MKKIYRIALVLCVALSGLALTPALRAEDTTELAAPTTTAKATADGIELAASERSVFEIYSITGQRVKSIAVEGGSAKVDLPKGCYIVRCAKWSKKVVVK